MPVTNDLIAELFAKKVIALAEHNASYFGINYDATTQLFRYEINGTIEKYLADKVFAAFHAALIKLLPAHLKLEQLNKEFTEDQYKQMVACVSDHKPSVYHLAPRV